MRFALALLLASVAVARVCRAVEPLGADHWMRGEEQERKRLRESVTVFELSEKYSVPEAEVRALRARGMGWGEAERALTISSRSKRPSREVADLRESGLAWSEVAELLGLEPAAAKPGAPERDALRDSLRDAVKAAKTPGAAGKAPRPKPRPAPPPPPKPNPPDGP